MRTFYLGGHALGLSIVGILGESFGDLDLEDRQGANGPQRAVPSEQRRGIFKKARL